MRFQETLDFAPISIGLAGETGQGIWYALFCLPFGFLPIKLNLFVSCPGSELRDVLKDMGKWTNNPFLVFHCITCRGKWSTFHWFSMP